MKETHLATRRRTLRLPFDDRFQNTLPSLLPRLRPLCHVLPESILPHWTVLARLRQNFPPSDHQRFRPHPPAFQLAPHRAEGSPLNAEPSFAEVLGETAAAA